MLHVYFTPSFFPEKIALNKCQNDIWNIFIWITTISHLCTSDDMPFRFTLIEKQCFDCIMHPLHNTKHIYKSTKPILIKFAIVSVLFSIGVNQAVDQFYDQATAAEHIHQ